MKRLTSPGSSSASSVSTCIQLMTRPRAASPTPTAGTLFSALQARTQAWQPVQRSRSITIPQRAMSRLSDPHPGGVEEPEAAERIRFVGDQVVGIRAFPSEEGYVNDVREAAAIELGSERDPSLRRLHPHSVPLL